MPRKEENTFTQREIATALNNATIVSRKPAEGEIPEKRLASLRAYSLALIQPLVETLDGEDGLLRPEESVFILSAAALFLHTRFVMKSGNMPALADAEKLLTRLEKELVDERLKELEEN